MTDIDLLERKKPSVTDTPVTRGTLVPVETEFGLLLPDNLSFSEWINKGRSLLGQIDTARLRLGDLVLYGERHFPDEFTQLFDEQNHETLRKAKYVCGHISYERRKKNHEIWKYLSFSHLDTVASLSEQEQDDLLLKAATHRWSRARFREEVANRHPDRPGTRVARAEQRLRGGGSNGQAEPSLFKANGGGHAAAPEVETEIEEEEAPAPVTIIVPEGRPAATEEAAQYLLGLSRAAQGKQLRDSLTAILEERDRFIAIANAAKRAVLAGHVTEELTVVVSETVDPTYNTMIELLKQAGRKGVTDAELIAAGVTGAATAAGQRSGAISYKPVGSNSTWKWIINQTN